MIGTIKDGRNPKAEIYRWKKNRIGPAAWPLAGMFMGSRMAFENYVSHLKLMGLYFRT